MRRGNNSRNPKARSASGSSPPRKGVTEQKAKKLIANTDWLDGSTSEVSVWVDPAIQRLLVAGKPYHDWKKEVVDRAIKALPTLRVEQSQTFHTYTVKELDSDIIQEPLYLVLDAEQGGALYVSVQNLFA